MKLDQWIAVMERIAPSALALAWDNAGLIIGPERTEISRVLLALDCTPAVVREAAALRADLVLTHHPQLFHPVKRLLWDAPETAAACLLLRHGIGLFAAHTNLDAAEGGINDVLSGIFGVRGEPFGSGCGRIGRLPVPETLISFSRCVAAALDAPVRIVGAPDAPVSVAAFVGGAGGMDMVSAREAGADVLVTGELKHSEALDAQTLGLHCVAAGHDETERIILKPLLERLQRETDDVQYLLAQSDRRPFAAV